MIDVVVFHQGRRTTDLSTGSRRRALARYDELARPEVRGDPVVTVETSRGELIRASE